MPVAFPKRTKVRAEGSDRPLSIRAIALWEIRSAVNAHETAMILLARHGPEAETRFWQYLDTNGFEVAVFDKDQARRAPAAFGCFGKGIHSKAGLNLADCAAYALAKSLFVPLLFKGNDFAHTDAEQWR